MSTNSPESFPFFPRMIATTFGCGYWPWGPGTMGAVGGVILWLAALAFCNSGCTLLCVVLGLILIFTVLGVWSASIAERYWGEDPSRVVMDETVGQWITMLPLSCFGDMAPEVWQSWQMWTGIAVSLAAFRFFDIVKPLGVRAMERLPRGYGIMADDILAGIYGAVVTYITMQLI